MGKFKYKATPGVGLPPFMDDDEKQRLIDENEPFEILTIRFRPTGKYGPKFNVNVRKLDGAIETISLTADGSVPTRDELLEQAMDFLQANKGETLIGRLSESGQTRILTIEED